MVKAFEQDAQMCCRRGVRGTRHVSPRPGWWAIATAEVQPPRLNRRHSFDPAVWRSRQRAAREHRLLHVLGVPHHSDIR